MKYVTIQKGLICIMKLKNRMLLILLKPVCPFLIRLPFLSLRSNHHTEFYVYHFLAFFDNLTLCVYIPKSIVYFAYFFTLYKGHDHAMWTFSVNFFTYNQLTMFHSCVFSPMVSSMLVVSKFKDFPEVNTQDWSCCSQGVYLCDFTKYFQVTFSCSCAILFYSYQQIMRVPVGILSMCSPVFSMSKLFV